MNRARGRDLLLKTVASAVGFLCLPSAGAAHSVGVIPCEDALPHPRITVTFFVGEKLSDLHGTVQDQVGTPLAGGLLQVHKKGGHGKAHAKEIRVDRSGRFTVTLPEGVYTFLFEAPGFQSRDVVVEIAQDAEGKGFQITLPIGAVTE